MRKAKEKSTSVDYRKFLWILWGILLAGFKLIYAFLPLFNLLDLIIFAWAGFFISHRYKSERILRLFFAVVPSLIVTAAVIYFLGWKNMMEGLGTGWLLSLAIIPASALVGLKLQEKFQRNRRRSR